MALTKIKLERILTKSKSIRQFLIQSINFNAGSYYDMVNWNEQEKEEPHMLAKASDTDIQNALDEGREWKLLDFPCHSQSVERHVKLVTEAAAAVRGENQRDGYIRVRLLSRKAIPTYSSKQDWEFH
jgi:hypothetical protein